METKPNEQKIKKERSTAYPYLDLEQALIYSSKLVEAYRKNPFSRQNAVVGIGYSKITGDTAQKIAALGHYGLLERSGNSAYRNSELAQEIHYFKTDEQKLNDIAFAAQQPKLFRQLIADHTGQSLPARLSNILVSPHGINPNVADKVAENFKKTLEYAGLLVNGVVGALTVTDTNETETPSKGSAPATRVSPPLHHVAPAARNTPPAGMQTLELPSGIIISYPISMAYQFAIGTFASQITELDKAITATKPKQDNDSGTNTPPTIQ